ncbi:MAG: hypothetical protein DI622_15815 [Chryseobacterium sp.]|nr:MAG: hypothetical protein DI622_15815 [Chryseobacterium sp.]
MFETKMFILNKIKKLIKIWHIKEKQHKFNEQILIPNINDCKLQLKITNQSFFIINSHLILNLLNLILIK